MLNPLSLQLGQKITGKEINDWCLDQIRNHGSHYKEAKRLLLKDYNNDRVYRKTLKIETGGGVKPHLVLFERV